MEINILYKITLFWLIFYITPGPVWISVMEATRKLKISGIFGFFMRVFLPVNLSIQFLQAIVSVFFIEAVSVVFAGISLVLYILGGTYIAWLAFKTLKSKLSQTALQLNFHHLALIMLLSPKIWLLFPSGAVIANQLSPNPLTNAIIYGLLMLLVSNLMFLLYTIIGKLGTKILKDNFSYLAFGLLVVFALFLFYEAVLLL